jgi:hypothetical protein
MLFIVQNAMQKLKAQDLQQKRLSYGTAAPPRETSRWSWNMLIVKCASFLKEMQTKNRVGTAKARIKANTSASRKEAKTMKKIRNLFAVSACLSAPMLIVAVGTNNLFFAVCSIVFMTISAVGCVESEA